MRCKVESLECSQEALFYLHMQTQSPKKQPSREAEGSEESGWVDHFLSIFLENVLKQGCSVCHGSKELLLATIL